VLGGVGGLDLRGIGDAHSFSVARTRLVGSLDFGTPVVDDPRGWGEIAVANALSDVYAVGATPVFVLSVLGWPSDQPLDAPRLALQAVAELLGSLKVVLGGGHSIASAEPLLGFAVIGTEAPEPISLAGFAQGDELWLTKPLGTGLLLGAARFGLELDPALIEAAIASAREINRDASVAALAAGCRAATDVSGFGLLGACREVALSSQVAVELDPTLVPWLDGVGDVVCAQALPSAADETWRWLERQHLLQGARAGALEVKLSAPETSGGLLLGLSPAAAERFVATCGHAVKIGTIVAGDPAIRLLPVAVS
jgi:selenium donor protein